MDKLVKNEANYTALSPLSFLKRAAMFYAERTSIIYGDARFTWLETYHRCCRLASSLQNLGVVKNDVVSVLAPNIPALYEMHFAVPMAGAILNAINTRLDANNVKTIIRHSEAKMLFVDYEYMNLVCDAFRMMKAEHPTSKLPYVVLIGEIGASHTNNAAGEGQLKYEQLVLALSLRQSRRCLEYEQLVAEGDPHFKPANVSNEWDPIALNYTSGTTSAPKGVVYSHRGAYLSTLSLILAWEMGTEPVYLWTLPMFHCNGWTFTWGVAARGGTNVCIRSTTAAEIYRNIALHGVTHMCCAPVVFNLLREAKPNETIKLKSPVQILTGGAPPPAALLEEMERIGFPIVHAYGLTEATGPALVCEWQQRWDCQPQDEKAKLKARQGITVLTVDDADVKDIRTMRSVPHDGKTTGEIVLRGSAIMKGYLKDEKATSDAFDRGWFHTGDVGVIHPDGYVEIKDRLKDVIISGGENISSVEVEGVLFKHPKVLEAAVVAMPHPRWGESPCAFVVAKKEIGEDVTEQDILAHCRSNLSHYMVPRKIVFVEELPKTSTGKVQKGVLRDIAKKFKVSLSDSSPHGNELEKPPTIASSRL